MFSRARSTSSASTSFGLTSQNTVTSDGEQREVLRGRSSSLTGSLSGQARKLFGSSKTGGGGRGGGGGEMDGIGEMGERDENDLDYDPAYDPDHRLRITRTATESIQESQREEDRRRAWRIRRSGVGTTSIKKLGKSRSIFGRRKTKKEKHHDGATTDGGGGGAVDAQRAAQMIDEIVPEGLPDMERMRTRMDREEQENKDRMERMDGNEKQKKKKEDEKKTRGSKSRRTVYVNVDKKFWKSQELDKYGQPVQRYARNKVRTSKYTLITFLPKNLGEQFRRVANIYFLALIILQLFPVFGAAAAQVAALPLIFILALTAAKDGVEDWRRHTLDNEVNNTAVTRLGDWNNVNQPDLIGTWYESLFGLKPKATRTQESRRVKRLRKQEGDLSTEFLYQDQDSTMEKSNSTNQLSMDQFGNLTPNISQQGLGIATSSSTEMLVENGTGMDYPPMVRDRSDTIETSDTRVPPSYVTRSTAHRSDVVNYNLQTPGTAKWERTLWKKLQVGDIVLLRENDQVPADMVILNSSDPDGICFVETKNLDGETNLKPRRSVKSTMGIVNEEDVEHARFWIDSEPPHANLYSYNAILKYQVGSETSSPHEKVSEVREQAVGINELLLRGCAIRNTRWVIGVVVFTGDDTKIMLNQGDTPSKRSKIEKETNYNVIVNFIILVIMCAICGVLNAVYLSDDDTSNKFYEPDVSITGSAALDGVITFGATLILFQNIVPISLVITVEIVKTIQALFIYWDAEMYYEPLDYPCVPKTWNISDDLGQIEFVFSDKTGTLTQNVMEFKKCSINGVAYGEGVTEAEIGAARREGKDLSAFEDAQSEANLTRMKNSMIQSMKSLFSNRYLQEDKLTLISTSLIEDMNSRSPQREPIREFFKALAICHSVLADRSTENPDLIDYKAESPDEAALVSAARDVGFTFINRTNNQIEIEVMGERMVYTPLRVLEFNSTRKRMSVIVRTPDNRILLLCKGADSIIYQRLRDDHDSTMKETTQNDLTTFANAGLRTLCIAYKYMDPADFISWVKIYDAACTSVTDRDDEIDKASEIVEQGLTLLGATALEDKLQVGVPDTIQQLRRAGLKLWILTGDKLQTAIEIGFSCNLLTNDMDIIIISSETEAGARDQIQQALDKLSGARLGLLPPDKIDNKPPPTGYATVIDGETLRFALDPSLKPLFLQLATQCDTVVCCRVSPSQKALTVKLVKEGKNAMTLAIGDGANDVAMIQEAHVGVGIAGLEGAQAAMSADYAVGQFRYLERLLLVHGRWSYIRIADMHVTFFFKNIIWTFTLFWYQIFCSFDSTYLYDYTLILLYNLVFTSLPCGLLGAFDQDVTDKVSLAFPGLYKRGIAGLEYGRGRFWGAIVDGLYESAIAFFIPYLIFFGTTSISDSGRDYGLLEFGTTIAIGSVIVANLFVGLYMRNWTWIFTLVLVVSSILPFVWIVIFSYLPFAGRFESLVEYLVPSVEFWASIVVVQVAALGPRYAYMYAKTVIRPKDNDIVRERIKSNMNDGAMVDLEARDMEEIKNPLMNPMTPETFIEVPVSPHLAPTRSRSLRESPIGSPQQFVTPPMSAEIRPSHLPHTSSREGRAHSTASSSPTSPRSRYPSTDPISMQDQGTNRLQRSPSEAWDNDNMAR